MACIILACSDNAALTHIVCDEYGDNSVFDSYEEAEDFAFNNPQDAGICFTVIKIEEYS